MIEDRLSKKQCVRVAALEKAIDSFNTLPQMNRLDTITFRAAKMEEYIKTGEHISDTSADTTP